mmetsp:Transcript_18072/g.42116  ORF Transcript_18072/g.42116 Transcript_18072/m.42116 type:complete len:1046 (+) Transcript_18072:91-3228(+)
MSGVGGRQAGAAPPPPPGGTAPLPRPGDVPPDPPADYAWLPHTSLPSHSGHHHHHHHGAGSPSRAAVPPANVAVRVRSASLAPPSPGPLPWEDRTSDGEEKKLADDDDGPPPPSRRRRFGAARRPGECAVTLSVSSTGSVPMQAAGVTTRTARLSPRPGLLGRGSPAGPGGGGGGEAAFGPDGTGETLSLPVRWRDLPRDAVLMATVRVLGGRAGDGPADWTGTVSLFDGRGRLRSGAARVRLRPPDGASEDYGDEEYEDDPPWEDDPRWRASAVLRDLDLRARRAGGTGPGWLDAMQGERCRSILDGGGDDDDPYGDFRAGDGVSRLVVEFPDAPVPILHEEPTYDHRPSAAGGSSGSVSAGDLIEFHRDAGVPGGSGVGARLPAEFPPGDGGARSYLYPLVRCVDPEPSPGGAGPLDPYRDKYRIMSRDLLRGVVDPGLRPDGTQRARLDRIVSRPGQHLSRAERDLLWRFRFALVDDSRALTKFLLCVDWSVGSEAVQAAELLGMWRRRSPVGVTDALKLLGRNVAFRTGLVRGYAVETLAGADDGELRLYLLQLVQAVKYEEDPGGGAGGGAPRTSPSLSSFLIGRAAESVELANYLYWYLRVEMANPVYESHYREVYEEFRERLSRVKVRDRAIVKEEDEGGEEDGAAGDDDGPAATLWDLLADQDDFITGIMECQSEARLARGKKDAKEAAFRDLLERRGLGRIPRPVPLPSDPRVWVRGVDPGSIRMFKSALYPAVLDFVVDEDKGGGGEGGGDEETATAAAAAPTIKVMVKTGDDLRQDQLVIMMIRLMDRLLKRSALDLCLRPYSILAMPDDSGLMEFVNDSVPVSQVLASHSGNSILSYFRSVAPSPGGDDGGGGGGGSRGVRPEVLQAYVRSCAGYCVLTYLLGVGDRHLDNIMIQPTGNFFHIDFGFIFGRDPKPLPPAFRLTKEMVDGMGGLDGKEYKQFCSLSCQAFNVLRKSAGLVLNLLHLMSDAGIEDLSNHPSADAVGVIAKVEERFRLDLTDEQAEVFFVGLINESLSALAPRVMEVFHQLSVARR